MKVSTFLFISLQGINVSHTLPQESERKEKRRKVKKNKSQFMTHIFYSRATTEGEEFNFSFFPLKPSTSRRRRRLSTVMS